MLEGLYDKNGAKIPFGATRLQPPPTFCISGVLQTDKAFVLTRTYTAPSLSLLPHPPRCCLIPLAAAVTCADKRRNFVTTLQLRSCRGGNVCCAGIRPRHGSLHRDVQSIRMQPSVRGLREPRVPLPTPNISTAFLHRFDPHVRYHYPRGYSVAFQPPNCCTWSMASDTIMTIRRVQCATACLFVV